MRDLIERQAAIKAMECVNDSICAQQAIDALCELPTAKRVGKWIDDCACSECHWIHEDDEGFALITKYNFCPNCGADMRGEDDD